MKTLTVNHAKEVNGGIIGVVIAVARVGYAVYRVSRAKSLAGALTRRAALAYSSYRAAKKMGKK